MSREVHPFGGCAMSHDGTGYGYNGMIGKGFTMNITSTAGTVHAVKAGYRMRSLCGGMRHTATKRLTDAPVDCPDCLATLAESAAAVPVEDAPAEDVARYTVGGQTHDCVPAVCPDHGEWCDHHGNGCPDCGYRVPADEPIYGEMVARDMTGHMRLYQTRNGRTFNEYAAPCVDDCDACNGTGAFADEPWYSDGML